jgi:hypothetical protein
VPPRIDFCEFVRETLSEFQAGLAFRELLVFQSELGGFDPSQTYRTQHAAFVAEQMGHTCSDMMPIKSASELFMPKTTWFRRKFF